MKTRELLKTHEGMKSILDKRLPIRIAYVVSKNHKLIEDEMELFEESRIMVLSRYSETDANGNVVIDEEGLARVLDPDGLNRELETLLETEVNITPTSYITLTDLSLCDSREFDSLTPNEIESLGWIISEEE